MVPVAASSVNRPDNVPPDGAVPVALEKRFDALVLVGAALDPAWRGQTLEEAAPWNFVFRVTTPTILINGNQDAMHPYEEGQIPFFDAIDVPETDKRMIVSDAGHLPPFNEIIRHAGASFRRRIRHDPDPRCARR